MKCKYKESCGYEHCLDDCCPEYEAATETNADRILAISSEKLADALYEACVCREFCTGCPAENCHPHCPGENHDAWVEWLQQPAEE